MSRLASRVRSVLAGTGLEDTVHNLDSLGQNATEWIDELSTEYECFAEAEKALRIAGGLKFDPSRFNNLLVGGVNFSRVDFLIDPTEWKGESEYINDHAELVSTRLYPIGVSDRFTTALVVDEEGVAYYFGDEALVGYSSTEDLIIGLIRGVRGEIIIPLV